MFPWLLRRIPAAPEVAERLQFPSGSVPCGFLCGLLSPGAAIGRRICPSLPRARAGAGDPPGHRPSAAWQETVVPPLAPGQAPLLRLQHVEATAECACLSDSSTWHLGKGLCHRRFKSFGGMKSVIHILFGRLWFRSLC